MAEALAGSLVYRFEADTSGLKNALSDVQSKLSSMSSGAASMGREASAAAEKVGRSFKDMAEKVAEAAYELGPWTGQHVDLAKNSLVGLQGALGTVALGAAAAAAAIGVAFAALGSAAIHMGEEAERAKSQFDLTGEGVARLAAVASKSGSDLNSLAGALRTVAENARTGDEGLIDAADAIGVSIEKLKSNDLPSILRTLQAAYSQAGDSANKYAAFQKILGSEFEKLYPIMQRGVSALDGLYAAADRSGASISGALRSALDGTIGAARSAGDAWTELKQSVEGAVLALYSKFKPSIDAAIQGFTGLIQNIAAAVRHFADASREGGIVANVLDAIGIAAKALVTALALVAAGFQAILVVAVSAMEQTQNAMNGAIATAKELWKAITFQGGSPLETLKGAGDKMKTDAEATAKTLVKIYTDAATTVKTAWGGGAAGQGAEKDAVSPLRNVRVLSSGGAGSGSGSGTDAIKSYIESLREAQSLAQAEFDAWGKGNVERAKALALARAIAIAEREGKTLTEEQKKDIEAMAGGAQGLKDKTDRLKSAQQEAANAARQWGEAFTNALDDALIRGQKLGDVLKNLVQQMGSMALRGLTMGSDGKSGIFGSLFSSIFAGFKAEGGPIPSGQWGIVGERGPEIITGPANITPMHKLGSGGGVVVHNYAAGVDVQPQMTPQGVAIMIRSALDANNRRLPSLIDSANKRS